MDTLMLNTYFPSACLFVCFIVYLLLKYKLTKWFSLEQTFPDEVLDLDKSVRTLDLTHNRLGSTLQSLDRSCLFSSFDYTQMVIQSTGCTGVTSTYLHIQIHMCLLILSRLATWLLFSLLMILLFSLILVVQLLWLMQLTFLWRSANWLICSGW